MKHGAIIVETRPFPNLAVTIQNHIKHLPVDWEVVIIHNNNPILTELYGFENNVLEKGANFNTLFTNEEFLTSLPFDKFLVFQHDSGILKSWDKSFEQYDWVGAPWTFQEYGGNGGLSWRSKDAMLKVLDKYTYNYFMDGNEDVFYCNKMKEMGLNLAPRSVCQQFSCEAIYAENTFGYHAIDKYLTPQQVNNIKYPNGISYLEHRYNELCNTPSDINEHLPVLHAFASRCSHITEMGVRNVVSTYALMMGMPKTLVSYDINMIPENEALTLHELASFHGIDFTFVCQDVLKVDIEPTEMLFIDTLHTYTQLKKELALHAKKVSKYIVFHDTTTYGFKPEPHDWQTDNIMENYVYNDKGLWPAIEEFLQENKQWKIAVKLENNNGLTILKKW